MDITYSSTWFRWVIRAPALSVRRMASATRRRSSAAPRQRRRFFVLDCASTRGTVDARTRSARRRRDMHAHTFPLALLATAAAVLAAMCFMAGPASGGSAVYSNASTITIPDSGTASPYPSPPTTFAVVRRATAVSAARGTVIRYTLSEPAAVGLRFYRAGTGRRVGTLRRAGRTGANRVAFSGRIGRRALRPGRYRLRITAVDPAGNSSVTRTRRFRMVRG
jgi:hypothetical protein